jgi:hypothetical protein
MRKVLGFIPCWLLFGMGAIFGFIGSLFESSVWAEWWYDDYNHFMIASFEVQRWAEAEHTSWWPWEVIDAPWL